MVPRVECGKTPLIVITRGRSNAVSGNYIPGMRGPLDDNDIERAHHTKIVESGRRTWTMGIKSVF